MRQKLPRKLLNSLRAGDAVRIHLDHYGSEHPRGVPFDVVLRSVEYDANFDRKGRGTPIVCWEPREKIDFCTDHSGKAVSHAFCDANFVVEILARAAYRSVVVPRNSTCGNFRGNPYFDGIKRSRTCVAAPVTGLAAWLLSKDPTLDIPFGLSSTKISDEWIRSGRPGLKGTFSFSRQTVDPSLDFSDPCVPSQFFSLSLPWLHVAQFRRWLLRRLPHIVRTAAEFRRDMAQSVKDDLASYESDIEFDRRWDDADADDLDEPMFGYGEACAY